MGGASRRTVGGDRECAGYSKIYTVPGYGARVVAIIRLMGSAFFTLNDWRATIRYAMDARLRKLGTRPDGA